jgi:hypothetical protein
VWRHRLTGLVWFRFGNPAIPAFGGPVAFRPLITQGLAFSLFNLFGPFGPKLELLRQIITFFTPVQVPKIFEKNRPPPAFLINFVHWGLTLDAF